MCSCKNWKSQAASPLAASTPIERCGCSHTAYRRRPSWISSGNDLMHGLWLYDCMELALLRSRSLATKLCAALCLSACFSPASRCWRAKVSGVLGKGRSRRHGRLGSAAFNFMAAYTFSPSPSCQSPGASLGTVEPHYSGRRICRMRTRRFSMEKCLGSFRRSLEREEMLVDTPKSRPSPSCPSRVRFTRSHSSALHKVRHVEKTRHPGLSCPAGSLSCSVGARVCGAPCLHHEGLLSLECCSIMALPCLLQHNWFEMKKRPKKQTCPERDVCDAF